MEAATSSCSAKDEFLKCIYSVVVADNNQKIESNEIFKTKLRCTKLSWLLQRVEFLVYFAFFYCCLYHIELFLKKNKQEGWKHRFFCVWRNFNKHGCNFDDVNKIGYTKSSSNEGFLKQRIWRYNYSTWSHQQYFIRWLKSFCIWGYMTKVW